MEQAAPPWVRVVTIVSVSVVALVAATASYVHMHELATAAGEGWRAVLLPLSVDGLLVAASMVMLVRRRAGLQAGVLPWLGLVLGLAASLAANVAVAEPTVLAWIVSGWPPAALAVSFELLILVTRETAGGDVAHAAAHVSADSSAGTFRDAAPDADEDVTNRPATSSRNVRKPSRTVVPARRSATSSEERQRVAELRRWIARRDEPGPPSAYAVKKHLRCGHDTAVRLLGLALEEPALAAVPEPVEAAS